MVTGSNITHFASPSANSLQMIPVCYPPKKPFTVIKYDSTLLKFVKLLDVLIQNGIMPIKKNERSNITKFWKGGVNIRFSTKCFWGDKIEEWSRRRPESSVSMGI